MKYMGALDLEVENNIKTMLQKRFGLPIGCARQKLNHAAIMLTSTGYHVGWIIRLSMPPIATKPRKIFYSK